MTFCYYIISVQLFLQVRSFSTLEVFLYVQPILFLHTFISVFFLWSYESFSFYPTNTNFSYFFIPDCSTSNYMKCCFRCHLAFFFFFFPFFCSLVQHTYSWDTKWVQLTLSLGTYSTSSSRCKFTSRIYLIFYAFQVR